MGRERSQWAWLLVSDGFRHLTASNVGKWHSATPLKLKATVYMFYLLGALVCVLSCWTWRPRDALDHLEDIWFKTFAACS